MQQVAGNQPAHAQVAANNDVDPGHDNGHAAELLQPGGKVHRHIGERLHPQLQLAQLAGQVFPLILALALGVIDLNGIQAGERLHQHRLAFVGELIGFLDPRHQRALDQPVHQQRPPDDANHQQDQQGKRQVDKGGQRQRRQEVADRLELLEVLRKAPYSRRAELHLHP